MRSPVARKRETVAVSCAETRSITHSARAGNTPRESWYKRSMRNRAAKLLPAGLMAALALSAVNTGPEAGAKVPAFEARDQNGRLQTFNSLKGPNGLMLVFFRSADW